MDCDWLTWFLRMHLRGNSLVGKSGMEMQFGCVLTGSSGGGWWVGVFEL